MRKIKAELIYFAKYFREPLIIAVTAFIISYVDPLGIEEATAARAQSTIMRLSAALFSGSNRVAVVMIDQAYVDSLSQPSWPPTYAEQGLLLRRVASGQPSAVFVDLLYKNPHRALPTPVTAVGASDSGQSDSPSHLLLPIESSKIPFYFSALPKHGAVRGVPDEFDLDSFRPALDLEKLRKADGSKPFEPRLAVVSWAGYGDYYPLKLSGHGALRTPAYALYDDYCAGKPRPDACGNSQGKYEKPMMVRWGAFVPGEVAPHVESGLCQYTSYSTGEGYPSPWLRLRAAAWQFVLALTDRLNEAQEPESRLPCMSFAVLPASRLVRASDSANDAFVRTLLEKKFVFVGADIPGIPDRIVSPVHGQTAGVMLHAMAMDNLLTSRGDYVRATPEWFLNPLKLLILCAVAIVAATRERREGRLRKGLFTVLGLCAWIACAAFSFAHDDTARGMLFLIGGALVTSFAAAETGKIICLFILISALALLMIEWGWEPANWIALAVAASFVQQISSHLRSRPESAAVAYATLLSATHQRSTRESKLP